jgi:hypothetical protein
MTENIEKICKKSNFILALSGIWCTISSGCSGYVDYERDIFLLLWAREREKQYSFSRFFYAHVSGFTRRWGLSVFM